MKSSLLKYVLTLALALASPAIAHKSSDAYLTVEASSLRYAVALKDIDLANDALDADNDRQVTWGEVQTGQAALSEWLKNGIQVNCAGMPLTLNWSLDGAERRSDGAYLRWVAIPALDKCAVGKSFALSYQLFKDLDSAHKLVVIESQGTTVLQPGHAPFELNGYGSHVDALASVNGTQQLLRFVPQGITHILGGLDHLAFLAALLLPFQFRRSQHGLLLRTITGFTIGHSVTLVAANLSWFQLSAGLAAWVEPAIAASVGVTALFNMFAEKQPKWFRSDVLALGFGLVHGLGFSEVMREAGVQGAALYWGLAGFNIGVELGQLLVLGLWWGAYYVLAPTLLQGQRHAQWVKLASASLMACSLVWLIQRI